MPSELQIQANRANARRSTGPKSPEGKARASLNAIRHGLSARNAVLPQEDRAAYLELLAAIETEYQPQGAAETFMANRMASAQWRLQRLARIETGFFVAELEKVRCHEYRIPEIDHNKGKARTPEQEYDEQTRLLGVLFEKQCYGDAFARLARYENMLNNEYSRALKALTAARDRRLAPPPPEPAGEQRALREAPDKTKPIPVPLPPPPARRQPPGDVSPALECEPGCSPSSSSTTPAMT
jgi:hypothetical protein